MRKTNTVLAVILALLVGAGIYYLFGTHMSVSAQLTRDGDNLTCTLTLYNRSLFPCEYLEFIASPDASVVTSTEGAGEDVPILSEKSAKVTLNLPEGQTCTLEVGYYVLGMRRTAELTIP